MVNRREIKAKKTVRKNKEKFFAETLNGEDNLNEYKRAKLRQKVATQRDYKNEEKEFQKSTRHVTSVNDLLNIE